MKYFEIGVIIIPWRTIEELPLNIESIIGFVTKKSLARK